MHKLLNTSCWRSPGQRGCIPTGSGTGEGCRGEEELRASRTGQTAPTGPPSLSPSAQPSPGLLQTQRAERPKSELRPPLPNSESLSPGDPGPAPTSPAFSGILPITLYPLWQHPPHLCLLWPHIFSYYVLPGRRSNLPLADKLLQRQFHIHPS